MLVMSHVRQLCQLLYGSLHPSTGFYGSEDEMLSIPSLNLVTALMGLDHERLTYRHAGREMRLTDVATYIIA